MTDPASHPAPNHRRDLALVVGGVVVGLVLGLIWTWTWVSPGEAASVTLLGSGKQVSVLVTNQQRRVLFVSGTDGSGFSNAIAEALPPIGDQIDVLLIDPEASADVIERAKRLDYKRLISLPGPAENDAFDVAKTSFKIDLGDELTISVRVTFDANWSATVEFGNTRLAVVPNADSQISELATLVVSLNGERSEFDPKITLILAGPATQETSELSDYIGVQSGVAERIEIESDRMSLPAGSVRNPSSGE